MALTGMLDVSTLVVVQGGLRLAAVPAASWRSVADEVEARHGWRPTLTDAYRDYAAQVKLFTARYERRATGPGPFGDVRRWNGVRYVRMRGASAAVPGESNHGLGNTVDVRAMTSFTSTRFREFSAVAIAHGWSNVEGRSVKEPWHWVKVGPGITPTTPQEDDMSQAEVAAITAAVAAVGQKVDDLLTERARYQGRNPLTGAITPTQDILVSTWDYSIKAYLAATAAKHAAAGQDIDVAEIAAALAPMLVEAVTAAVASNSGLTAAEAQAAAEQAMRNVLGSLD